MQLKTANALLAAGVVLLTLVAAEVVLRLGAPVSDPFEDLKTRRFVNQYIRSSFTPRMRLETEAEAGLPGLAGKHVFTTNNVGLRGDSLAQPKPPDEYRVFMIGGSTVEGLYLDDSQTITAALQRALARTSPGRTVKVYNAGKSGDKSDDHVSMLAHRLVHLEPALVIVMMGFNDLRASVAGFDYRHFDPRPAFTSAVAPPPLGFRNLLTLAATQFQLPRRAYYAAKRLQPRRAQDVQQAITLRSQVHDASEEMRRLPLAARMPRGDTAAFRRNAETLVGIAAAQRFQLVLVTHPATWDTGDSIVVRLHWMRAVGDSAFPARAMDTALQELNDVTRAVAARHHVPLYDLARSASRSSRHFYDDTHFNVAGAESAGQGLASFLSTLALPGLTPSRR